VSNRFIEDYKRELEKMKEPPSPALVVKTDPVEELVEGVAGAGCVWHGVG
jgi:hypothetical protein